MTFIQFAQRWTVTIFRIITDLYTEIMSHDFTAFAFWASIVCGLLALFAYMTPSVQSVVKIAQTNIKKRKQENRDRYAQFLLTQKDYSQSRYVTIEGKRYYRKGLVQRGERMKSSDRDFSYDLEDIDNT